LCRARRRPILRRDRVSQIESYRAQLSVCVADGRGIGADGGAIELRYGCVEALPKFDRTAPPGTGPKLVRGLGTLSARKRAPGQPELCGFSANRSLSRRRLAQSAETIGEICIRRSQAVCPHCLSPLVLGSIKALKQRTLSGLANGWIQGFRLRGGHPRLSALPGFLRVHEPSSPLLPRACRRSRAPLERGEQLLKVVTTNAPDLADAYRRQHAVFNPHPDRLRRHRKPLRDLADGHKLWLVTGIGRHANYR
jgi:hypothetical protein